MIDYKQLFFDENEKPLDRLTETGGFTSIFRTIACIGDSLSSGEFQCKTPDGVMHYNDYYEYSWGQYIARMCGNTVYNFSKGGMTAKQYMNGFADSRGLWDEGKKAQAYIIALGCNDLNGGHEPLGSIEDVHDDDPSTNADTYAGWYGRIVARYKKISPDAKFFFMTMPGTDADSRGRDRAGQAALMYDFAAHYTNSYVIDLYKYATVYDKEYRDYFYLLGHETPSGYYFSALQIASYIDWIIRHNMKDFKRVGYMNTPFSDTNIAKLVAAKEKAEKAAAEAAAAAAANEAPAGSAL